MIRPVDAVIEFLEAEQRRGASHVLLDDEARDHLRELHRRASQATAQPAPTRPATAAASNLQSPQPSAPPAIPSAIPIVTGTTKPERLASLHQQAARWPAAIALTSLRPTMVFATGNPDARIMLIGEAPGHEEEKKGEPFAGSAGGKLDQILLTMGTSRSEVYLTNIMKFRPATPRQTTNNRTPNAQEIAACLPFVRAEIEIVRPQCIIALGSTAAESLLETSTAVSDLRGSWHEVQGIPVRVSYHPSCLLSTKTSNNNTKRLVWEDMLAVMERLEMPISEKQRNFFLPKK